MIYRIFIINLLDVVFILYIYCVNLVDFNKDTFRDFILDERGRELYCEGHRRDDLIRHGKYIEYARKDGMDAKDYHILFPIPQKALNENSNLKQNPGYEN